MIGDECFYAVDCSELPHFEQTHRSVVTVVPNRIRLPEKQHEQQQLASSFIVSQEQTRCKLFKTTTLNHRSDWAVQLVAALSSRMRR